MFLNANNRTNNIFRGCFLGSGLIIVGKVQSEANKKSTGAPLIHILKNIIPPSEDFNMITNLWTWV